MSAKRALIFACFLFIIGCSAEVKKEYFDNGKLKAEWQYRDGQLDGTSKEYYPFGELAKEWNYKNGKLESISKNISPKAC